MARKSRNNEDLTDQVKASSSEKDILEGAGTVSEGLSDDILGKEAADFLKELNMDDEPIPEAYNDIPDSGSPDLRDILAELENRSSVDDGIVLPVSDDTGTIGDPDREEIFVSRKSVASEPEERTFSFSDKSSEISDADSSSGHADEGTSAADISEGETLGQEKEKTPKKRKNKFTPVGDPFSKTDAALAREGSDLIDELNQINHETSDVSDLPGIPDTAEFDAVVGSDGAISGILGDDQGLVGSVEEIPEIITAASEKKAESQMDEKGRKNRRGRNQKNTETAGEKINGTRKKKVRRRASFWQVLVRLFLLAMCVCILGACALGVGLTMYLADVTADDYKLLNIDNIKLSLATIIMVQNKDTGEWYEHQRIYAGENRVWVDYTEFPDTLIDAIIASEDHNFRTHHGVDWKRTTFAFLNTFLRLFGIQLADNVQGGSTITQQLIKNITGEDDVKGINGILRKIREIYRALEMEKNYSKTQILEAYLNTIRLSGQVAGIEAAAKYYFNKTTSELSIAESAAILCITKAPGAYNPYEYPEDNKIQREYVIRSMKEEGLITDTQYDAAMAESEDMVFYIEDEDTSTRSTGIYDYFTDVVIEEVLNDLIKYKNLDPSDAYDLLYEGGLRIYTTMDPKVQAICEKTAWDDDLWPDYKYDSEGNKLENQIEAAFVVMNYDGEVVGCAGGIREKTTSLSLSRCYSTTRQTGSAIKPIAVYAPAIELKKIHFSTLFPDVASQRINGLPWPVNFEHTYGSPVTVYKAVCKSLNTIAVLTMQLVGIDFSFDFLTSSLGFTTLVDSRWDDYSEQYLTDRTASLALGGLTDGLTVTEMCAAYCVFGNKGVYKTPRYYTLIEDSNGDVVLDKNKVCQTNQALSPETAYIMNQIMQGVVREGTATALRKNTIQPLAAKTGTSSDNNDFWICALNPYYCSVGWLGKDLNGSVTPYSIHYDIQYAVRDVLNAISNDLPVVQFERPSSVVTATFCMSSGDLASGSCTNKRTGYYTKDNMPTSTCMHSLYNNDGEGKTVEPTPEPATPATP